MDIGVISVRYARALMKSATEAKLEAKVYAEMQTLADSYLRVPELRQTIDNPMLSREKKEDLLLTACGAGAAKAPAASAKAPAASAKGQAASSEVSTLTQRFLHLVLEEGRESALQFMALSYITLYRQQKNIIRGRLITAAAVSPATEQKMKQMVESKTQGTVEFQTEVNPDIIGGFILEYGTYRMDASVKSKLKGILTELKK